MVSLILWIWRKLEGEKISVLLGLPASCTLILCHISTVSFVFRKKLYLTSLASVCILELFSHHEISYVSKSVHVCFGWYQHTSASWLVSNLCLEQRRCHSKFTIRKLSSKWIVREYSGFILLFSFSKSLVDYLLPGIFWILCNECAAYRYWRDLWSHSSFPAIVMSVGLLL